jgi:hypothetical protein
VGSNLVPDDIAGLSSTHIHQYLSSNPSQLLYEAEIDHGKANRVLRFVWCTPMCPLMFYTMKGSVVIPLDEICCWVRKEYSTRSFLRVYSNRIESNSPQLRYVRFMIQKKTMT